MLRILNEKEVSVLPGLFAGRMKLNAAYLRELEPKMLLQNYYLEAGEIMDGLQVVEDPSKAPLHWGWEAPTCQLRGHFLGHYLSAAAAIVAGPGDTILSARIDHIVRELGRLQKLNANGWVAPIPEKYFTILMTDRYIWSPQYTMHKLLMGLTDVWELLGNAEALTILSGLADWYLAWVKKATEHATATARESAVFAGEQAGMLEIWARLYAGTEDLRYRKLAEHYEGNSLFDVLDQGGDPLTDNHANASIPLAHGAACMYEVTGEEKWKMRVLAFWEQAVTRRGMLATSGANAGEFWIPPQREGEFLSRTDQEFCTVYNMVRVAAYLYKWTGDMQYADYIERALYNGFLAQQSGVSGMPTYFLPMLAGSRKKWGTKRNDFWCCFGTMVQAQTLYPSLIYAVSESERTVYVSQYIPSDTRFSIGGTGVHITQNTGMKNYSNQAFFDEHGGGSVSRWTLSFTVETKSTEPLTVAFRVPGWCKGTPQLVIDGKTVPEDEVRGMMHGSDPDGSQFQCGEPHGSPLRSGRRRADVHRTSCAPRASLGGRQGASSASAGGEDAGLNKGGVLKITRVFSSTQIVLHFAAEPVFEPLPDEPDRAAVLSGPVVLAGLTDRERPLHASDAKQILRRRMTHTYSTFPWEQDHFVTVGQAENFELVPLYEVEDEAYTVYFPLESE